MGAGASSLAEHLDRERAMKLGGRYGFTSEMFDKLHQEGFITVKQLINCVKKHTDLQAFDKNKDGTIDKQEMTGLVKVLKEGAENNEPVTADPPLNLKTVFTGTMHNADYLQLYQPVNELGSGMSGTVFSVQHKESGAVFACKSVRKRGIREDDLVKLRGEVALLSQLDHPNIVKIIEAFEDESHITIIMELCKGGELYDKLITAEFYTEHVARNIFRQIMLPILYCHNQQVCHRDLKLENFVFDDDVQIETGKEVLKLIDFGLSKRYSALNKMSTVVGTPYYIAPEIIKHEQYGLECDIWSLGIILFMLLTGIPPVSGESDQELLANVARGKLSLENQWTPDWTTMADAFDLIKAMLTIDPTKRITAHGIKNHPWLAESNTHAAPIDFKIVEGMRRFSEMDPLQRIASKIVAVTLSTKEIEKLREAFISIDRDQSGIISVEEFSHAMADSMAESQEIKHLFQKIDMDGTGTISYSEFISSCLSRTNVMTKERLLAAFSKLDPDNSGFIEEAELIELLKGVITSQEAQDLIRSADLVDSDGRVSKAEFMSTVSILWNAHTSPVASPKGGLKKVVGTAVGGGSGGEGGGGGAAAPP